MLSAALFFRRWSVEKIRAIRNSLSNRGSSLTKFGDDKNIPSLSENVGKESTVHMCIYIQESSTSKEHMADQVVYKDDEDRFSQRFTMKLKTFSLYTISLELDKDEIISYVILGGKKYNCFYMIENKVDRTRIFKFVWSTDNILSTKRSHRSILPCVIKFKSYRELRFNLLVKFYERKEWIRYTGTSLKLIDMQVQLGKDTTISNIGFEQKSNY